MARKLHQAAPAAAPAKNPLADLYVMKPPVKVPIGGRKITLGEYNLWDGLVARDVGKPLIDDLEALGKSSAARDAGIESYLDLLAKHRDVVRVILPLAIPEEERDEAYVNSLQGPDAQLLLMAWWNQCGNFFWRVVVGRKRDHVVAELRRKESQAGPTSSTPSPTPATDAPATSGASTPSAS